MFYGVKGWDDAVPSEIYDHALETGMFEYDNGNMKMYHDIDMNNHKLINISLDIFPIYLYGNSNGKVFANNNFFDLQFDKIYIKSIQIFIRRIIASNDRLVISQINPTFQFVYRFSFPGPISKIIININKYFVNVDTIKTMINGNFLFKIEYLPLKF